MKTVEPWSRPTGARRARVPMLALVAVLASVTGCRKEEIAHYRVPKAAPADPSSPATGGDPGAGAVMPASSDLPPPPTPTGKGALRWTLPAKWTESQGGGGMRFATLKAPVDGKLDVSVTVLPGPAGGELANVNRWRGQIGLPNLDDAALAAARKPLQTKAGPVSLYDFTSEGDTKSRVVAGLTIVDGNTWFLKMTGDAGAVAAARPDFLRIVESLRLDVEN